MADLADFCFFGSGRGGEAYGVISAGEPMGICREPMGIRRRFDGHPFLLRWAFPDGQAGSGCRWL
ncbi:MAG: hypothetical protein J6K31_00735 [Parabacteroides sp.]|nr:hypothetical protein [Parabacteroides sp.]